MRLFPEDRCFTGSLFGGGPRNLDFILGVGSHGGDVDHLLDLHREFPEPPEVDGS
jgi:hypothetical protein